MGKLTFDVKAALDNVATSYFYNQLIFVKKCGVEDIDKYINPFIAYNKTESDVKSINDVCYIQLYTYKHIEKYVKLYPLPLNIRNDYSIGTSYNSTLDPIHNGNKHYVVYGIYKNDLKLLLDKYTISELNILLNPYIDNGILNSLPTNSDKYFNEEFDKIKFNKKYFIDNFKLIGAYIILISSFSMFSYVCLTLFFFAVYAIAGYPLTDYMQTMSKLVTITTVSIGTILGTSWFFINKKNVKKFLECLS